MATDSAPGPVRADDAAGQEDAGFDAAAFLDYASFFTRSLRRHFVLALGSAALVFAFTVAVVRLLPRTYRVDTSMLVQADTLLGPLATGGLDKVTTTKGVTESILRRENLISVIRQTGLVERWKLNRPPLLRFKDALTGLVRRPLNDDELVDSLVYLLEKSLVALSDERTVTIEATWRNPDDAYRIAAAAQQNFLESRQIDETSAITDTIAILEAHVAAARQQVEAALDAAKVSSSKDNRRSPPRILPTASEATVRPSGGSAEALRLQGLLEAKRRSIEDIEQLRRRRLAELQAQYTEQRGVYAESHPILTNLRDSIQALGQDSTQLAQLRREAQELETEYQAAGGRVGDPAADTARRTVGSSAPALILRELPTRDPREELDKLQLSNATAKYNAVLDRLNSARLTLDTARGSFKYRYVVVRPPLPPKIPISPKTVPLLAAGAMVALAAGVLAALGLELRKGLVVQRWQIERLVGIRLLGELPAAVIEAAVESPSTIP